MTRQSPARWRQAGAITLAAAALLALLHLTQREPRLDHRDFAPTSGPGALQFCDPANPRLLSVVSRLSPVSVRISAPAARTGEKVWVALTLSTTRGKPIPASELLPTAGLGLQLLVVGPGAEDFQAPPASAGAGPGTWSFEFEPRLSGLYRVFADFTPRATGREMYGSAEIAVAPGGVAAPAPERDGFRFALSASAQPIRAREPIELVLTAERTGGGDAPAGPVAHLAIFDLGLTGLVNLHAPLLAAGIGKTASFRVTLDEPGTYVVWARSSPGGRETAIPFRLEVLP